MTMSTVFDNRKLFLLLLFTAIIVAGSYAIRATNSAGSMAALLEPVLGPGEPPVPDTMPAAQQVEFWSNRLAPDTKDYITLTHLGRAYLMTARETGDAA
ncbi:MAG: hypothetical protein DCC51_13855, partial [Anaerolineae bacterium]